MDAAALVFPLVHPLVPAEVSWLPAAVVLVLGPIAAAMVLYARRGDRARLLLVAGVLLMVAGNVAVMAVGRSGAGFVASRYGTVVLWVSAISPMAIASLMRAPRGRWRKIAIPIGIAGAVLLGVHLWRYQRFVEPMSGWRCARLEWQHNLIVYFSDDSPDRNCRPPSRFQRLASSRSCTAGSFSPRSPTICGRRPGSSPPETPGRSDAVTAAAGVPGPFTWGSWNGSHAHTGTLTSTPFGRVSRPDARGERLSDTAGKLAGDRIDGRPDEAHLLLWTPIPEKAGAEWRIDRSQFPAGRIRVVAVDGRQADGAWVGVQFPVDRPAASRVLEAVLRHLVLVSTAALALIGVWGYGRRRGGRW